jgi:hypothetical protein
VTGVSFVEILMRRIQTALVPSATPEAREIGARACRELATALEPPLIVHTPPACGGAARSGGAGPFDHEDACKRLNKSR